MSLNSPILSRRSAAIAARFGAKADEYEEQAGLQADVARRLAAHLPDFDAPKVLELGCGTGLLSRHLAARYPKGKLRLTDAAPAMIRACRSNLDETQANVSFEVMDAAAPIAYENLDLIVTSMMLHWLPDPLVLATEGLPSGAPRLPEMPCVVEEEHLTPDKDSLSFLRRMKAVGGLHPRDGYVPLTAGDLRRAIRATNFRFGGRVTWHIVYGRLQRS